MNQPSDLPQDLRASVESELQAGERIVWMDQPIPGRLARSKYNVPLIFGIIWSVVIVGMLNARNFSLVSVAFILIPLGLLSAPYWAYRDAKRVVYALTNRRAVILRLKSRGRRSVRSFEPERLTEVRCKQRADGSGDLVFRQDITDDSENRRVRDVGFLKIRNVRRVRELLASLVEEANT